MLKIIFFIGIFSQFYIYPFQLYINFIISFLLICILIAKNYNNKFFLKELMNSYNVLLIIWIIWGGLSFIWSASTGGWINHMMILVTAFGYSASVPSLLKDKQFLPQLKLFLFITIVINLCIGLLEVNLGRYFFTLNQSNILTYKTMEYPVSFFYNPNDFAVFISFGVVFLTNYKVQFKSNFKTFFFSIVKILLISISIYLMFKAQSRLSIIATGLGLTFSFYFLIKKNYLKILTLSIGLIIIGFVIVGFEDIILIIGGQLENDDSANIRINLIKNGIEFLKEYYYLGIGAGNTKYYLTYFSNYPVLNYNDMHNWWIEILVSYGIPFFSIYILFYLKMLFTSLNKRNIILDYKYFFIWLIVFILASMTSSSAFQYIWLWTINSIVFCTLSGDKRSKITENVTKGD